MRRISTESLPTSFRVGHILEGVATREQFEVVDVEKRLATLRLLPQDERVKPVFLHGRLKFDE
jgi:hypothetical protein